MRIQPAPLARHHRSRLAKLCLAALGALLLGLLTAGVSLAGCPVCNPPDKVTVRSPGAVDPAAITDTVLLKAFNPLTFLDFEDRTPIATPAHSGTGYELIRYFKPETSGSSPRFWTQGFDRFYFDPNAGDGPAVYYDGPIGDSMGMANAAKVGHWFRPLPREDAALRQLIQAATGSPVAADQGVSLAPQNPATLPSSRPAQGTPAPPLAWVLLLGLPGLLAIALLAVGAIRKQRRVQSPAAGLGLTTSHLDEAAHEPEEVDALLR
jgi:hypothetical protein